LKRNSKHRDLRYDAPVVEQHNATGKVSYWRECSNHSASDREGVSLADYIHAIFGFLAQAKCRDVLMIGCGGGTLATMLHRVGARATVLDIDPASFEIARNYFHMPAEIECHVAEGAAFLRRTRRRFDAIVLDAFADGEIPAQFLTPAFFALAKRKMRPRGALFLANVIVDDDGDRTPDRMARTMKGIWRHVRLLDCDGWLDRNAVVVAGAASRLRRPRLLMPPRHGSAKLARGLKDLVFRALRA
jgi:2-polyprenyl-3-methyl-5-hydroxy-6-metoxy-1,4-benzoquinol methylase